MRLFEEQLLPSSSFVSFQAKRLVSPKVAWQNEALMSKGELVEYAYCLPVDRESGALSLGEQAENLLAERYGSDGLGRNAGGVRCGLIRSYQIKGVGRNQLAGYDTDFFHSYGGASLNEAILEALWGEVCSACLPYGAARVAGILLTGTRVPQRYPKKSEIPSTPRALIVRQFKVRPAHFMRSPYCDTKNEGLDGPSDARRTNAAIASLPSVFAQLDLIGRDFRATSARVIYDGINKFLERSARQVAVARAKRIMHGSLNGSNVSLDGAWLDFGSITATSDYGRLMLARGAPDFMHEERALVKAIKDLFFYIGKYDPTTSREEATYALEDALRRFNEELKSEYVMQICSLSGVPRIALNDYPKELLEDFSRASRAIMESGNLRAFRILSEDNEVDPVMPPKMGDYQFNKVLIALSSNLANDRVLSALLPNEQLRTALQRAHLELTDYAATRAAANGEKMDAKYIKVNCIRKNQSLDELYRTNLYPRVNRLCAVQGDYSGFIDNLVRDVRPFVVDETNFETHLPFHGPRPALLRTDGSVMLDGAKISLREYLSMPVSGGVSGRFVAAARVGLEQ